MEESRLSETANPFVETKPKKRRPWLPWALFALTALLALWALWKAFVPVSHGDPLGASLTAFEKQNRLTVFSAQLSPVVASDDSRLFGMLKSRQIAVIPARVDYTLDLSRMNRARMGWDEKNQRLDVLLPPITVSRPNLDEGRAQYLREGIWITGDSQSKLTRENTRAAELQATNQATNPALMELARNAAKDAVRQNLAIPLQVAGYGAISVNVRFEGEKELP